ncbi:helix-turn-helix transcriptional regulator [Streptomyces sp. NPDC014684]|uniref:helix-turn-helix domain-containing protein n=1 Tax=unclassified Streptomyces TaxID=2593676 RepID=UPI0033CA9B42
MPDADRGRGSSVEAAPVPCWAALTRGLANRVGVTNVNLSVLKNGRAKAIRFTTLTRICEVLQCQPGDLLSYRPGSA